MAIRLRTEKNELLFTGDVMHNERQVACAEFSSMFCLDAKMANATRNQVINDALENDTFLFPAHFRENSAGKIAKDSHGNTFWAAATPAEFIDVD